MQTIKAIETHYKGYRFRSRLEARWAVFFDALGLTWGYEMQGYKLPNGQYYLPDFLVPSVLGETETYEIKPTWPDSDALHKAEAVGAAFIIGSPGMQRGGYGSVESVSYCILSTDGGGRYVFAECRHCQQTIEWYPAFSLDGVTFSAADGSRQTQVYSRGEGWGRCKCCDRDTGPTLYSDRLDMAFAAARSARFEFGETPA